MKKNQRVIFVLPGDTIITEVIFDILKNNGLEESPKEAYYKSTHGKDSRLIIIRDAALTIIEKKIPDNKLVELLQTHLNISNETAEKIIRDIKEKITPYAKVFDLEVEGEIRRKTEGNGYKKANFQKELLDKIKGNISQSESKTVESKPSTLYDKKPQITNVDKNAEKIKTEKRPIIPAQQELKSQAPPKEVKPDTYREPIE